MGDERDAAALGHPGRERQVQPTGGSDPAQTVRPEEAQRALPQPVPQLPFSSRAGMPRFPEPGRDDDRGPDPLGRTFPQDRQDPVRRDGNDGEVHRSVDIEHALDRGESLNRLGA